MKNEEILKKAIEKAEKNGYNTCKNYTEKDWGSVMWAGFYYAIIFSHDFAKAFWGEDYCDGVGLLIEKRFEKHWLKNSMPCGHRRIWQFHLSRMVLEEEPLLYIKQFL